MNGIGFQGHTKLSKRITAWILTFVMAVGVLAAVPAKRAEAAGDTVTVTNATDSSKSVYVILKAESTIAAYSNDAGNWPTEEITQYAVQIVNTLSTPICDWEITINTSSMNYNAGWNGAPKTVTSNSIVITTYQGTDDNGDTWTNATIPADKTYTTGAGFQVATSSMADASVTLSYKVGESESGAAVDDTATDPAAIGKTSADVTATLTETNDAGTYHEYLLQVNNNGSTSIADWIVVIPVTGIASAQNWAAEGWGKFSISYTDSALYLTPAASAVIAAGQKYGSTDSANDGGYKFNYTGSNKIDTTKAVVYYTEGSSSTGAFDAVIENATGAGGSSGGSDNPGTGSSITGSGAIAVDTTSSLYPDDEYNYAKLLQYALYFYDANMCGDVEGITAMDWRYNCHSQDKTATYKGKTVDVSGGYHDAGDHDKFALTEGYSASILGMGYYEFKEAYEETGQQSHYKKILDYFCDSFLKRTVTDSDGNAIAFCYQVGDGRDHQLWKRADKENIDRPTYFADADNPATDQICEPAAAMAIHYVNFGEKKYLEGAKKLFALAKNSSKASTPNSGNGETYYGAYGYADDYCLAAIWLYKATGDQDYITEYKKYCGNMDQTCLQAWAQVGAFAAGYYNYFYSNDTANAPLAANATRQINKNTITSDGGFLWLDGWGSARYNCNVQLGGLISDKEAGKNQYGAWATGQMRYLLGNNGHHQCYVTWYNDTNASRKPHHRSASDYPNEWTDFNANADQTHKLLGALVGGPSNTSGDYTDTVKDATFNEVAIDYNAAFTGAAAALYLLNKEDGEQMLDTNYEIDDGATCDANAGGDPTKPADETNPVVKTVLKDSDITFPTASPITYGQTLADSELSITEDTYGTYAWKTVTTKPNAGNAEYDIVYTPTNTKEYNYKGLTGYDAATGKVVRKVSVTVNKKEITSVTFPTVTGSVKSGTALSAVTLSKTSDDYGTFAWASPTTVVANDTTGEDVVYTLKDSDNYKIASTVTGVNETGTTVTREVTFTVKKVYAATDVPPAPTLNSKTDTTVTLGAYTGDGAATIEYGVKKGDGSYTWQKSNIFTGLTPWTIYTFAMRFADIANYVEEGKAGDGLEVVTYLSDVDKYTVALSELTTEKAGKYVEAHNGTIEYDAVTKTLTLLEDKEYTIIGVGEDISIVAKKDVTISMGPANFKKLTAENDLTIELSGENTITEGIFVLPKDGGSSTTLTVRNEEGVLDGSLTVGSDEVDGKVSADTIYVVSGKLTVSNKTDSAVKTEKLNVTGGEIVASGAGDAAIAAKSITVEDGSLTADGTNGAAGMKADKIIIGGGTVDATGSGSAAAITTEGAVSGEVDLYGGVVTVNNESDTVKPVVSDKIVYDGAVVHSDSDPWSSNDPVDKNGNSVVFRTVTYSIDEVEKSTKVTVNSEMTLNKAPDKAGYKFDGWYKDSDETKVIAAGTKVTVTDNVKYTAVYTKITGELAVTVPESIPVLKEGYTDEGITISIKNNTNVTVDNIAISLNGIDKSKYTIDKSSVTALKKDESASVKITLNAGLAASAVGYSVDVVIANNEVSPKTETIQLTRKVYLNNENSFKIDISKLNDPGYIEIHNGTVSYDDDVLTLESEGDYTITGKDEELVVKVKDGINGDDISVSLTDATVKDIQGTDKITKDDNSKVISKESGDNPDDPDLDDPDPDDPDPVDPDKPVIVGELGMTNEPYINPIQAGYSNAVVKFTIKNGSNIKLDSVGIALSEGDDSAQYSLSVTEITGLEADASKEVILTLKDGLPAKAEGYKTTVIITNKELNQQINMPIVRKVYLSDADSRVIDVSKLDEPGYVEIHNGTISYEKTVGENGETIEVLNLLEEADYTITGSNAAIVVKAAKPTAQINLNNATVKDVQGTTNYKLNGSSTIASSSGKAGDDGKTSDVQATGINLTAKVKGVNDLPVSGTLKLAVKKTIQLSATFTPENAVASELTYESSNPKVATVSATGKITAKKAGKATITVKSSAGLTKVFKVQVMKKPVKKLTIKASKKTVKVKKTVKLKASISPNKKQATTNVYWKSSNPKIATVTSKGVVKGVKKGKVKITAIATDGSGKKATIKLQVK